MYDVAIVMPVYNEEACIGDVVSDWTRVLDALEINYRMIVLNDGSRDNTAGVLRAYEDNPNVQVVNKPNSGHGPTILQGYRQACEEAEWVFQVDSDNEMPAEHFKLVWDVRTGHDAVIGIRDGRMQPLPRKVISAVSRMIVRVFYGFGIADVNCPFRLMRSAILKDLLRTIPDDTFAPNVALSGMLVLHKNKIQNVPIPHNDRQTGEVSIKKWKLLKAAVNSCLQTILIRWK